MSVMPMKVREVIRLLEKHGWVEMRSKGSHRHFKNPVQPMVITVPGKEGKELAPGTLNAILKKPEMSSKRYPAVIEKTGTGFSAYSPDVLGCVATGDTEEETREAFQDALSAHFAAMREVGEEIPEPQTSVDYVEVAA
jgi:predicted RNA binding protein YcfA (HicA-like mRNA interferase family)/predicted RNase H-like HicB family nuclease